MSASKDMKGFSNQGIHWISKERETFVRESMHCWLWDVRTWAVSYCSPPALPAQLHLPPVPPVVSQSDSSSSPAWPDWRISSSPDCWERWASAPRSGPVTKWCKSFKLKKKILSWWVSVFCKQNSSSVRAGRATKSSRVSRCDSSLEIVSQQN